MPEEQLMVSISSFCCRQGVWLLSVLGVTVVGTDRGWAVVSVLGWDESVLFWKYLGKEDDMGRNGCMVHSCVLCSSIIIPFFPILLTFLQVRS